jgi:hypothetical protein
MNRIRVALHWLISATILIGVGSVAQAAQPDELRTPAVARFALIIGVNQSPEPGVLPLRYADDDAARYRDLFRAVGARTFLLASLDENTRRLHPEAAAEAAPARTEQLSAAVAALASAVAESRRRGARTVLHVFYAGHGGEQGHTGYVALENGRVTGPDLLEQIFDRVRADDNHLVVDACSAYLLVLGRGPGGQRRPLQGFSHSDSRATLLDRQDIGLLLSTSSARESHEWAAFQAGVFSHEVRSGLFGAADADGDGVIGYPEIRAFIARANESIPNDRYRPELYARAPSSGGPLLDIRAALLHRVDIPATAAGHHFLEDPRGVRLVDFHNDKLPVHLVRLQNASHLYLQRTWDGREYLLPAVPAVLDTAALAAHEPHVAARSAANDAFTALFALPYDGPGEAGPAPASVMQAGSRPPPDAPSAPGTGSTRRIAGWTLIVTSAMAAAVSAELFVSARALESAAVGPRRSAEEAAEDRQRGRTYFRSASLVAGLAGVAALTGSAVLLWPESSRVQAVATADGGLLAWHGRF